MPLEPSRFRTAAQYYLRGRPPYAAGLIRRAVPLWGLRATRRVLGLGCGPRPLALALTPFCAAAVRTHPEAGMLRPARDPAAPGRRSSSVPSRLTPWARTSAGSARR